MNVRQKNLKERTLISLGKAIVEGEVDEDVICLLSSINDIEGLVTTSSCSGRIQLISMPGPGDKLNSNVLGKWHKVIDPSEVEGALGNWDGKGMVFLLAQPLLLHIRVKDLQTAVKVRNACQGAGMKYSSIRSLKMPKGRVQEWGVTLEVMATERMEVPLHILDNETLKNAIPPLVAYSNELILRTKGHIPELKALFSSLS